MRVVAGSERSTDLPQSACGRHLDMLSRLAGSVRVSGDQAPAMTLILRAPCSSAAKALVAMTDELARAGLSARVILAMLEPEDDLRQLIDSLSMLAPRTPATELLRFARNPRLHEAHEQAVYGETMCWSGDAMRRDADKRNALDVFHEDAPDRVRLARRAFTAMWAASAPVPERYLRAGATPLPSGEYERPQVDKIAGAPLRPSPQGWPLVRH